MLYSLRIKLRKTGAREWGRSWSQWPMGLDRAAGRAQAMELEPGYINSWLWLDTVDSNQASISIQADDQLPWEAQMVVVGWPALLGFGPLVRSHYIGGFLSPDLTHPGTVSYAPKQIFTLLKCKCVHSPIWQPEAIYGISALEIWLRNWNFYFNFNEVKMASHMCKYTAQL